MDITSVTSKYQATIPLEVRKFLGIEGGDKVAFSIDKENKRVTIKKHRPFDYAFHKMQEAVLAEDWLSPEDEEAFKNW